MIDKTISHYTPKADEPLAHKIIEQVGQDGFTLRSTLKIGVMK